MREVGASTVQFENFLRILGNGCDLNMAFAKAEVAEFVREVTGHTLKMVLHASPVEVMACFLYGREDVIPRMFSNLQKSWELNAGQTPTFVYYLKSHIELDGDSHGPAAEAILENAIQGDPDLHRLAMDAAGQSIQARVLFWDGVLQSLQNRVPAGANRRVSRGVGYYKLLVRAAAGPMPV
ncbi:MAG: DUF3050 domain-containing protein [Candidatus Angelobacter sp.]